MNNTHLTNYSILQNNFQKMVILSMISYLNQKPKEKLPYFSHYCNTRADFFAERTDKSEFEV